MIFLSFGHTQLCVQQHTPAVLVLNSVAHFLEYPESVAKFSKLKKMADSWGQGVFPNKCLYYTDLELFYVYNRP